MSRVGNQPIEIPSGVTAQIAGQLLKVEGPKGKLSRVVRDEIEVKNEDGKLVFVARDEKKSTKAFHGLERALAANFVTGVSEGFAKELALIGTGYRAEQKGKDLVLSLGFSHPVDFKIPDGVKASLVKDGRDVFVRLESADKQLLGEVAARMRALRPPEPYKGKGVRYRGEEVRTKAGKSGK